LCEDQSGPIPIVQVHEGRSLAKGIGDERYRQLIAELVSARRTLNLSQKTLGRRLGAHQQFVSRYETGERRLDVVEFCEIASELNLDPVDLVRRCVCSSGIEKR
jgi:ribosome-binding protein aMBF1 (putative translation factor)